LNDLSSSSSSSSSSSWSERPTRRASLASEYSLTGRKARRMPGSLVQASCGHRLEQTGQDSADRYCDGCNASCEDCPDSGAIQWFRCAEGCIFELCGSCQTNGYPSAPFPSFFGRWSVQHTSAAFWSVQPCPMHSAAQRGASGRRGGCESATGGGLRRPLHGSARVLFAVAPAIQTA
jgi:hypothetical protein